MTKLSKGTGFAQLFKKYRLRSEIETLAEFGDLLAEEGFVYETSLFTRWQKGDRVPKERRVLLAILRVFVKRGGIVSIEEGNTIIESLNQKNLTYEESTELSEYLQTANTKTLPAKPYLFIGREELLKDLTWKLINKKKVLLYGMPGVGKTYIAIYLAHQLKNFFPDGIFWFRADLKSFDDIVDELLGSLGGKSFLSTSKASRVEKLNQILVKRNILLVLDNTNVISEEDLKSLSVFPLTLVVTSINKYKLPGFYTANIKTFNKSEFILLCENVLGKPYVKINQTKIIQIGIELGYLPISSVISLKQIFKDPIRIHEYIRNLKLEKVKINDIKYDNKSLYVAINLAFNRLGNKSKYLLISCAVFDGTDFGIKALSAINNQEVSVIKQLVSDLRKLSFIEYSRTGRYRLHPAVKEFLREFLHPSTYKYLSNFYIKEMERLEVKDDKYFHFFSLEIENILSLIKKNFEYENYQYITKIWPLVSSYIFISGKWKVIYEYDSMIQNAYRFLHDDVGRAIYLIEDLGRVYFFQKREKELQKLVKQCLVVAHQTKNKVLLGLIIQKQGIVNLYSNNYKDAKSQLLETIKILSKSTYKEQLYKSYAYLGMTYANLGDYRTAIKHILKALNNIQLLQDVALIGFIYLYLGNSYLKMDEYHLAEKYLKLSLNSAKRTDVLIEQGLASEGLALLYAKLDKNNKRAKQYLKDAKSKFKLLGMNKESKFFH